jgi:hypothetical protein
MWNMSVACCMQRVVSVACCMEYVARCALRCRQVERRKVHVDLDYVGFTCPDAFVVGFAGCFPACHICNGTLARPCQIIYTRADPAHICTGTGGSAATSAPGLGSPLPHLHRHWAHSGHICTETGLTPARSASGQGSPAATSAPGLGSPAGTSAPGPGSTPCHICTGTPSRKNPRTGRYGLDFGEEYRCLPDIAVLKPSAYAHILK